MLIFSDLHLRESSGDLVLGTILPALHQEALARKEFTIACLGDALHFRYRVPVDLLNGLRDWCLKVTRDGIDVIWLPGNHDQYEVSGRNALEPLGSIDRVRVHTQPCLDAHGLWIPYRKNPEAITKAIVDLACDSRASACFTHHGFRGARTNDGFVCTDGVGSEQFSNFRAVLTGHYHGRQTVEHVSYIGSPYQTKADEVGQDKGFAIWNGVTLEYVTMSWGKRYHKIQLEKGQILDMAAFSPDDDVRVTTAAGVDPLIVGKQLVEAGIASHTVTPTVEPKEARLELPSGTAVAGYAKAYAERFGGDLDPTRLMDVYQETVND